MRTIIDLMEIAKTGNVDEVKSMAHTLQLRRHKEAWDTSHLEVSENDYVEPTSDLPFDADIKAVILACMEKGFDQKLRTNTVEIRAKVEDENGTTPALRLKARPSDAGMIQGALGIMAKTGQPTYRWWNSPSWHSLTADELTKLLNDGVASIATLFAEFEALTKSIN